MKLLYLRASPPRTRYIAYQIVRDIAYNEVRRALVVMRSTSRTLYRVQRGSEFGSASPHKFWYVPFFCCILILSNKDAQQPLLSSFSSSYQRCLFYRTTIAHHPTRSGEGKEGGRAAAAGSASESRR